MDKSVNMGIKLLEVKGNEPADIPIIRETSIITVTGYDISLPRDDVVRTLRRYFCVCGKITDVYIRRIGDKLNNHALIYFMGKSALGKALKQLNGRDLGGWKALVEDGPNTDYDCAVIRVSGFDTSLDVDDIKIALTKHFSSCGRIIKVVVPESTTDAAMVYIVGDNAAPKALTLGVSSIQGRKVVTKLVSTPINPTTHRRRNWGGYRRPGDKAKMTAE